jgi:hypothetical protein
VNEKGGLMPRNSSMDLRGDYRFKYCRIKGYNKRWLRKWRDKQIEKFLMFD